VKPRVDQGVGRLKEHYEIDKTPRWADPAVLRKVTGGLMVAAAAGDCGLYVSATAAAFLSGGLPLGLPVAILASPLGVSCIMHAEDGVHLLKTK